MATTNKENFKVKYSGSAEPEFLFSNVEEIKKPKVVRLTKKLPSWAEGTAFTVFPAKWDFKEDSLKHLYDGFAMMLKVEVGQENVTVVSKYLESEAYKKACQAQRAVMPEIGTQSSNDSSKSLFSRITNVLPNFSDNGNRHIFKIGNELFVGNGLNAFYQIDPSTLSTGQKINIRQLFGQELLSANPITDFDGSVYTFCQNFSLKGTNYNITRSSALPEKASVKEITRTLANSKFISSFNTPRSLGLTFFQTVGFTKNYIVLVDQPYYAEIKAFVSRLIQGAKYSLHDITTWNPKLKNQFILVEKSTGRRLPLQIESSEPFFFFDIINAFEDGCGDETKIVMDINCYPTAQVLRDTLMLHNLREGRAEPPESTPRVHRFIIPLTSSEDGNEADPITLKPTVLADVSIERPTINRKYIGKPYQFYYGTSLFFQNSVPAALFKVDTISKELKTWKAEEYVVPGHPIFIPKPGAADEDDGILMAVMTDARKQGKSYIVFLDGKTFEEVSRAEFDGFLPVVLYGLFEPK